ncbi:MAG: lipid II flippase MurJ, partial [bacterium]
MTLLSRLGGLVRDVLVGRIFGDTAVNSAFAAAFAIPNMFRRLFGEGALSAAFIPASTQAQREDRATAAQLASMTLAVLGAVTSGLVVVAELALLAVLLLAPPDPERDLSLRLIMVMLPFMPLIC